LVSSYVPCILLKAIGYTESTGWKQFVANYGQNGPTVVSGDCGYGIMQITSGMTGTMGFVPGRVAAEPAYNIGAGAYLLITKWNENQVYYIGNNDPFVVEDWYYTVWSYYGWGWQNNPNNLERYPNVGRASWACGTDPSQSRSDYPYQELIWGCAANPPNDPINPGTKFWQPVPLTLPPRGDLYTYEGGPPPEHINTPQPSHGSCSVVYLPITLKDYPPCIQVIQNGGFEAGVPPTPWVESGKYELIHLTRPHSGNYSAWLGGYNDANDVLYQTITIPPTGPTGHLVVSARVGYYWYMSTDEPYHAWDWLTVKIRDDNGVDLVTLERLNDGSSEDVWNFSSFDLSSYIGRPVQVYFQLKTDGDGPTSFFIDDVVLYACEGQ
jgi:hypothetical protein